MFVTVATDADVVIMVECVPEDTIASIKQKVEDQIGFPVNRQHLTFQRVDLTDEQLVMSYGISDGDLLMLREKTPLTSREQAALLFAPLTRQQFIDQTRANPTLMSQLDATNPALAEALRANDGERVEAIVREAKERETKRMEEIRRLEMNPMDIESQKRIEELIQQQNIEENLMQAHENTPEMFATVTMLYVKMEVNGIPVYAFVDTGAQMTIMTQTFAEKCSLTRLIDKRFAGIAHGVGQSRIIGRVHQAPLKVGNDFVTSSLVVLELTTGPPFIFGLDNLIRHRCNVDLKEMKLVIGSIGAEVPFLTEHQVQTQLEDGGRAGGEASPSSSSQPIDQTSSFVTEENIKKLMDLGFGREQCEEALRKAQGNLDAAAALLYGYQ